jgi:hypothetical protein
MGQSTQPSSGRYRQAKVGRLTAGEEDHYGGDSTRHSDGRIGLKSGIGAEFPSSGDLAPTASTYSLIANSAIGTSHFHHSCSKSNGSLAYSLAMC